MDQPRPVRLARLGLVVEPPGEYEEPERKVRSDAGWVMLPACRDQDILLEQPPLTITLTGTELAELTPAGDNAPRAATCFGPLQDKLSNEDAALACRFTDEAGGRYDLAIVADGVTTGTFWANRSARIACLSAYRTLRHVVREEGGLWQEAVEEYRAELVTDLVAALSQDRELLLREGVVPKGWDADLYHKHRDRLELWVNSTLLIGCLGPSFGLGFWAGDGCVIIRKSDSASTRPSGQSAPLRSTADLGVTNVVNLAFPIIFKSGIISYDGWSQVELLVGTDGFDRTAQRGNDVAFDRVLAVDNSVGLGGILDELASGPGAEVDNSSIAVAHWHAAHALSFPCFAGPRRTSLPIPMPEPRPPGILPENELAPAAEPENTASAEADAESSSANMQAIAPNAAPSIGAPKCNVNQLSPTWQSPADQTSGTRGESTQRRALEQTIQELCGEVAYAADAVRSSIFIQRFQHWGYRKEDPRVRAAFRWFGLSFVFGDAIFERGHFFQLHEFAAVRKLLLTSYLTQTDQQLYFDQARQWVLELYNDVDASRRLHDLLHNIPHVAKIRRNGGKVLAHIADYR